MEANGSEVRPTYSCSLFKSKKRDTGFSQFPLILLLIFSPPCPCHVELFVSVGFYSGVSLVFLETKFMLFSIPMRTYLRL